MTGDVEFKIMIGRGVGSKSNMNSQSFINQVLRAARKAGYDGSARRRRSGPRYGHATFWRGRTAFGRSRTFGAERRVIGKARVVRHHGRAVSSAPLSADIAYLQRDGEKAHMFGAVEHHADARAFVKRGPNDRHHFRFIVAPEDAAAIIDLKAFTRDLAGQMESDLSTRLDWIAISHWNTDNPHIHLLVRGVAQDAPISSSPATTSATACERVVEVRRWLANYQDVKGTIEAISELNHDLSRPNRQRQSLGRSRMIERWGKRRRFGDALIAEKVRGLCESWMSHATRRKRTKRSLRLYVRARGSGMVVARAARCTGRDVLRSLVLEHIRTGA